MSSGRRVCRTNILVIPVVYSSRKYKSAQSYIKIVKQMMKVDQSFHPRGCRVACLLSQVLLGSSGVIAHGNAYICFIFEIMRFARVSISFKLHSLG